jgi:uncharacterized protein YecT (DUF1311 family)
MIKFKIISIIVVVGLSCQFALAQNSARQPYELTPRGVITSQTTNNYRKAIEDCYIGEPGNAPQGREFLECLKKQVGLQDEDLTGIYEATLISLRLRKNSDEKIKRLQYSQKLWMQFRDANCAFARSVAGKFQFQQDESFYDCMLRSAVERQVELSRSVGE